MASVALTVVGPVIVTALACAVAAVLVARHVSRRRTDVGRWACVYGTVMLSSVQIRRVGTSRREVATVMYRYDVDGRPFRGSRIRLPDERKASSGSPSASSTAQRYPTGAQVVVYYDPDDPSSCALER